MKNARYHLSFCVLFSSVWLLPLSGLRATESKTEAGLSDQQLFAQLDLTHPGLERVKAAVESENWPEARTQWAQYLRIRKNVARFYLIWNTDGGPRKSRIPRGLENFSGLKRLVARMEDGTWQGDHFCRHGALNLLTYAYRNDKDPKYARMAASVIRKFVTEQLLPQERCEYWPPSDDYGLYYAPWVNLNFASRIQQWYRCYSTFVDVPEFDDDALVMMCKSMIQQMHWFFPVPHSERNTANKFAHEMLAFYLVGSMLPEHRDATQWRKLAIEGIYDYMNWRFMPDGTFFESSGGYSIFAFTAALYIYECAFLFGRENELPGDMLQRYEKFFDYTLKMCPPDRTGYFHGTGHSGEVPNCNLRYFYGVLERALEHFPDREDYRYGATYGKEGKPPAFTSCFLPYGGYCVMRSGWTTKDNCLILKAGYTGETAKQHADHSNISLWAYGRPLLYDALGGRRVRHHNTAFVDGRCVQRRNDYGNPVDAGWESTDEYDYARAESQTHERSPWHVRRVLYLKPDIYLVIDNIGKPDEKEHDYSVYWNYLSKELKLDPATLTTTSCDQDKPNLAIIPLDAKPFQAELLPDPEPRWAKRSPAAVVKYHTRASGPVMLSSLLVPLRQGAVNPVRDVTIRGPGSSTVALADGRELAIDIDPDHKGCIRIAEKGGKERSITAGQSPREMVETPFPRVRIKHRAKNIEELRAAHTKLRTERAEKGIIKPIASDTRR